MTTDTEDRSTWPRKGQIIRREELLRLIEENGGPEGLDLRGAIFVGEGPSDDPSENPVDLSPAAVRRELEKYRKEREDQDPPWWRYDRLCLQGMKMQGAELSRAHLEGAYLVGVDLRGARLLWAHLEGANLQGARLQEANLLDAHLEEASLCHARLGGANLAWAHLEGADLRDAQLEGAWLYEATFRTTRLTRQCIGKGTGDDPTVSPVEPYGTEYGYAREAYLALKTNFQEQGRYEDARWAYVKEQQMEKGMYFPTTWGRFWISRRLAEAPKNFWGRLAKAFLFCWLHIRLFLGVMPLYREVFDDVTAEIGQGADRMPGWEIGISRWRWLRNWFYELTTGYGERPWNAVLCGLGAVLAFAVGFWATGAVGGRGAAAFFDSFVYSISAFATFNLARPDLNPEGRGVEIASSLEAILGIGVLALVVFTLGNRMSRG